MPRWGVWGLHGYVRQTEGLVFTCASSVHDSVSCTELMSRIRAVHSANRDYVPVRTHTTGRAVRAVYEFADGTRDEPSDRVEVLGRVCKGEKEGEVG